MKMKIFDAIKSLFHHQEQAAAESCNEDKPNTEGIHDSRVEDETPASKFSFEANSWDEALEYMQLGFSDFTTEKGVVGFYLDPENRWLQLAREVFSPEMEIIYHHRLQQMRSSTKGARLAAKIEHLKQVDEIEEYNKQLTIPFIDAAVLKAVSDDTVVEGECDNAGRNPFPFRLVFGILVAQAILDLSDRGICKLVSECPYLQMFLGYTSFSASHTIDPSNLVHFRKRLDIEAMNEINEIVHKHRCDSGEYKNAAKTANAAKTTDAAKTANAAKTTDAGGTADDNKPKDGDGEKNSGTLVLDATCGPVNIRYPQDYSLLNEGRMDLENIINRLCRDYAYSKPRTYVKVIQAEATNLSKSKRKSGEDIRHVIRIELNAIKRNLEYIEGFLADSSSVQLTTEEIEKIQVVRAVYCQQSYKYDLNPYSIPGRIVSISLPFIRPIIRGKVHNSTEFGPKYDIAIDENGFCRLTAFSFDNFSESEHLQKAAEKYKESTGHYPERILADQIYRNKANRQFCKEHGIRLSGPPLGRKPVNEEARQELIATEKQDMIDRITVERHFSRQKRCFGIERIVEKTEETIGHAVGMAIFLDNVVPNGF